MPEFPFKLLKFTQNYQEFWGGAKGKEDIREAACRAWTCLAPNCPEGLNCSLFRLQRSHYLLDLFQKLLPLLVTGENMKKHGKMMRKNMGTGWKIKNGTIGPSLNMTLNIATSDNHVFVDLQYLTCAMYRFLTTTIGDTSWNFKPQRGVKHWCVAPLTWSQKPKINVYHRCFVSELEASLHDVIDIRLPETQQNKH